MMHCLKQCFYTSRVSHSALYSPGMNLVTLHVSVPATTARHTRGV